MLDPGRLRHLVTIQGPHSRTPDGGGGFTQKWRKVYDGTVWAEVRPLEGSERQRAMKTQANATHVVTMRYRADVTARHRLVHEERVLQIVAPPVDEDERHEWLEILAREET